MNALCYAELASRFPTVVGGAYMYSYSAFDEITTFLVFVQLMLDYHIGAASISRSLARYAVALLELFPAFKGIVPLWMGSGKEFLGGFLSLNLLAPVLLAILTFVLCQGVRESCAVNSIMTAMKVVIILVVICAGAFDIDIENWSPFVPNGFKAILTGATVVFFYYVGFDVVFNSTEESKNPQRDLPIGIMGSLMVCISLYISVCLVLTGMVPFSLLNEDAPLAKAFSSKGTKFVSVLISVGAVAGLTSTVLVGLYVQSRLYLGLGRDGHLNQRLLRLGSLLMFTAKVCDPKSMLFLFGMQLDYSDALIGEGFSLSNPNATQTCGCGKSFAVEMKNNLPYCSKKNIVIVKTTVCVLWV